VDCAFGGGVAALSHSPCNYSVVEAQVASHNPQGECAGGRPDRGGALWRARHSARWSPCAGKVSKNFTLPGAEISEKLRERL